MTNDFQSGCPRLFCVAVVAWFAWIAPASAASSNAGRAAEAVKAVQQLGDDDPAVRHAAEWRLRDIGLAALPALREGAQSSDPQVRIASKAAIKAIGGPLPSATPGPIYAKTIREDQHRSVVDFHEGKRVVRIEGDVKPAGEPYRHIKMTFTGPLDGKIVTQVFSAENEAELRWNAPQAWKYFHSIFNRDAAMAAIRVPNPVLNERVNAAMDQLKVSAEERKQVRRELQHFSQMCTKAAAAEMYDPASAPHRMAEEDRASDDLRKFLADRNLPIVEGPGEMDPPPEARLGLCYLPDFSKFPAPDPPGLLVKYVAIGSRGERIGIKAGDVVEKINGTDMQYGGRLRDLCVACPVGMIVEVFRGQKSITLHEKPDSQKPKQ